MQEGLLQHGAIPDQKDDRDYIYESGLGAGPIMTDKDWQEGYDIEKVLGFKLPTKNQWASYSCVSQAYSMYRAVKLAVAKGYYTEDSAKAIYSQISIGYGKGAYLRDGAKLLKEWGEVVEEKVKSYRDNGTTDETWMIDKGWFTDELTKLAKDQQVDDYKLITGQGIDYFARAIKDGHGCVIGVTGTNNGTWTSAYPLPPTLDTPQSLLWGHGLYAGKIRLNKGKKEIGVKESWGEEVGEDGWQWLGEEWFTDGGKWVFNPWVLITNNKIMSNVKILKDSNSSAVGVWMPAISEDVLKSYCLNAGKDVPMKDGHIDWDKIIEGEFQYK